MGLDYVIGILILSGINLMTALGLSLLTGFTGLFSFGHAGFIAIGAYTATTITMKYNIFRNRCLATIYGYLDNTCLCYQFCL